ncbi:extensin family protein [Serratia sp. root2]|uniref:extensin-like domain-containing protein n=1 Tax=Serratia sp. root2 TaxID=3059676 RepID=UPI00288D8EDE|nr:extensin family protein [Serratia sp. root2]MDT3251055.1 extensin family protein [Serratia sp. root2]
MRRTLVLLSVLLALVLLFPWASRYLPPGYHPFAPLTLDDPPTLVTRLKLRLLADDPVACMAILTQARDAGRIGFTLPGDSQGECPLVAPVKVQNFGEVRLSSSFLASCPLALSSAMFVGQIAEPQAQRQFGVRLARIDHLGSYACRNIYHRPVGRLSEHATAEAWDIAGFRLANGNRLTILRNWPEQSTAGSYLRTVFEEGCGFFGSALGPEYNAAHANHFHFGMRGYGLCR